MSEHAIQGTRIGSGPVSLAERDQLAPRYHVVYWCLNGHETRMTFCVKATEPETWDCARCGLPAGRDQAAPPHPQPTEPYKTHLAYVKERRTDAEGEVLLAEALAHLRQRREGSGSVPGPLI